MVLCSSSPSGWTVLKINAMNNTDIGRSGLLCSFITATGRMPTSSLPGVRFIIKIIKMNRLICYCPAIWFICEINSCKIVCGNDILFHPGVPAACFHRGCGAIFYCWLSLSRPHLARVNLPLFSMNFSWVNTNFSVRYFTFSAVFIWAFWLSCI